MDETTRVTAEAGANPRVPFAAARPQQPLDIVVAEDERTTREAVCRFLRELGHSARAASDGHAALAMIEERPADVLISDWEMPGLSGVELCRLVRERADDDGSYTYVILITGLDDRAHLMEGMDAGADDFQAKPLDLDELEARLVSARRVVALHRRLAERTATLRRDSRRHFVASRTDPLTSTGNRLALSEELDSLRQSASPHGPHHALAICDVDFFKRYNDRFGHLAGDEALRHVAETIRANVRGTDAVFRYGGEEFVVVFRDQSLPEVSLVMERVRAAIERLAIPAADPDSVLTISAGVAAVDPRTDETGEDWLSRADAALYGAKADGRNRVEVMHAAGEH
jgi:two-component system, cell cycle response regulator